MATATTLISWLRAKYLATTSWSSLSRLHARDRRRVIGKLASATTKHPRIPHLLGWVRLLLLLLRENRCLLQAQKQLQLLRLWLRQLRLSRVQPLLQCACLPLVMPPRVRHRHLRALFRLCMGSVVAQTGPVLPPVRQDQHAWYITLTTRNV
jgi:hypothetical protein